MSANGSTSQIVEKRWILLSWSIRLIIAFILSVVIVLAFFVSGAVSR